MAHPESFVAPESMAPPCWRTTCLELNELKDACRTLRADQLIGHTPCAEDKIANGEDFDFGRHIVAQIAKLFC